MTSFQASGLLSTAPRPFTLNTIAPTSSLSHWVDYFWIVEWQLAEGKQFISENLPHPVVHLVFDPPQSGLFGPQSKRFKRTLSGTGRAIGCRFKAGQFYPFYGLPMSTLCDRKMDIRSVFQMSSEELDQALQGLDELTDCVAELESLLLAKQPDQDENADLASSLVKRIESDSELIRVEQLSELSTLSTKGLERLFKHYVGPSPKQVLRTYRLQQAANQLTSSKPPRLTELAHQLGYFDQAHFIKDFKKATGQSPGAYLVKKPK